ncbi:MAG: hypothetical protein IEMM0008_0820 [bacterium]|nr:MAG: hypothetical protein IEMM0008_0820 [bacterium]
MRLIKYILLFVSLSLIFTACENDKNISTQKEVSKQNNLIKETIQIDLPNIKKKVSEKIAVLARKYSRNYNLKLTNEYTGVIPSFEYTDLYIWKKRVTLKNKTLHTNIYGQKAYQRFHLSYYQYKSPDQMKIALDKWYRFHRIVVGVDKKHIKEVRCFILLNKTDMIVLMFYEPDKVWERFLTDAINLFKKKDYQTIDIGSSSLSYSLEWNKRKQ